jgi:carotenoid 1,2-hydratase
MTERRRQAVTRTESTLSIGPSSVEWDGTALVFHIDEIAVPISRRVRGVVRVYPAAIGDVEVTLDVNRRHHWRPIAPVGRVVVELDRPALRWSGNAYLDTNAGEEPLENAFSTWHWSRAASDSGATILYDVNGRQGDERSVALQFDTTGASVEIDQPPPTVELAKTLWRVNRITRTDSGTRASVISTLEDAPFYARSLVSSTLLGQNVEAVHESLSLDRFRTLIVKAMLPFRMPRTIR